MGYTPEEDRESVLTKIFKSASTAKILDFFLDHKNLDYSLGEVAEKAYLSSQTVSKEIANLEQQNLLLKHRIIGKTPMYRLNTKLRAIVLLSEFVLQISQVPSIQEFQKASPRQDVLETASLSNQS